MNIVIVTNSEDPLSGVFWRAYMASGGLRPAAVFFLESEKSYYSFWQRLLVPLLIFRLEGTVRLISSVYLGLPLTVRDKKLCLNVAGKDILESNIPHSYHYKSLNNQKEALLALRSKQPDLLVSVGAPEIFKRPILEIPKIGAINIHNGNVPKYRGHFGTFWEVYNGERWGYICVHEMEQKVDTGRILASDKIKISDFSSFLDLMLEKKRRGGILLAQVVQKIQNQEGFPEAKVGSNDAKISKSYYSWPSFESALRFQQMKKFR